MTLDTLGEVIATRKLLLVGPVNKEVSVKMGKPRLSNHNDYCCPVQIVGIGSERIHGIFGADAFQSIQLAIEFIGKTLRDWTEQNGSKIQWELDEQRDVGFPSGQPS
ncbi:MAG: hypothetical protein WB952_12430 [Terriglobales bacterium]